MTDALIISNAKDTNGQNARYARASERVGTHEAVITALAIGKYDPAGVVGRYQLAATKHDVGLRIRSAHKQVYEAFDFPTDILWTRKTYREISVLARDADVIHLNNSDIAAKAFNVYKKPLLLHHHGSMFRNDPQRLLAIARARKMVQAVSTIDLQRPSPDVLHWLPTAYDVGALQGFAGREPDDRVRIVHCPTGSTTPGQSKYFKHTELFVQVVNELIADGLPIDLVVLRDVSQAEVYAAKAEADIVYDQLLYGYGCNSVEAWAMGKPVISGADEWTTKRMRDLWGDTPYAHATERTLKAVIRKMVQSPAMREDVAQRGLQHVLAYHDELPALTRLAELYHDAIKLRNVPRIQGKGILFRSNRPRVMHIDGIEVELRHDALVTDEIVVEKLRDTIRRRPRFGLSEVVDEEGVA